MRRWRGNTRDEAVVYLAVSAYGLVVGGWAALSMSDSLCPFMLYMVGLMVVYVAVEATRAPITTSDPSIRRGST